MLSDAEIMTRVQAGDEQLFALLVPRYRPALLRFAVSKLADPQQAEDIVQETLLAAFRSRNSYSPRFALSTWLWTILLNLCRGANRDGIRRREVMEVASFSRSTDGMEAPWESLLQQEEQLRIRELLNRLPDEEADALRLRFLGGLKFEEIALAMDSSLGAAKMRVRRGLLRLRDTGSEI